MAVSNTCLLKSVFIYIIILSSPCLILGEENPVSLKDGDSVDISLLNYTVTTSPGILVEKSVSVQPQSTITLNVLNVPRLTSFVLVQTHSYQYNTTLSYSRVLKTHYHINGTDIGLVQLNSSSPSQMQFFILNENDAETFMLVTVQAYGRTAPIPGGCNMEFSVEIAPYLSVRYTKSVIIMETQPASLPSTRAVCDDYSSHVQLEVYHMHLPERDFSSDTYFDAIRKMSTVQGIREYGKKVPVPLEGSSMRRIYSAYPGTGSVYGVVAISGQLASAYVPAITYACGGYSPTNDDSCDVLLAPFSKLFCAMVFFCGLLMCFCGHRFFKTEIFLLGFLVAAMISYIVIAMYHPHYNELALDVFAFFTGMGFGLLWLLSWICLGVPILSVIVSTLTLGYVLASVVMFAGLGDVMILQSDVNFWVAFGSIMCTIFVLSFPMMHKANIVSCAILGAFAVITPIDHYIGSNLKFIVVNTVRRATVTEFNAAFIDPPFQLKDCLLSVVWIFLSAIGSLIQLWQQQGKPPFPPPPYQTRDQTYRTFSRINRELRTGAGPATDRTPLMVDAHIPYGATPDSVFDSPHHTPSVGPSDSSVNKLFAFLHVYQSYPAEPESPESPVNVVK